MCRGDRREAIFHDEADREVFVQTLGEMCERAGFAIHSYVLMSNHYHLLMETPAGNLVAGMQWFQTTYTARYNARHRQAGHLFQGRYKAVIVEEEEAEYGRIVSDYIHLNPARAGLVNGEQPRLKDYRWSSFPGFCQGRRLPGWLRGAEVLAWHHWKIEKRRDREAYENYLQERAQECWEDAGRENEEWKQLRRGWFVGGENFRDKLEELAARVAKGRKRHSYAGEMLRKHDATEAGELLKRGLEGLGLTLNEARNLRQNDPRKQALIWLVKSRKVVRDQWIQEMLITGNRSNVSRAVSACRAETNRDVRRWKKLLHKCTD